MNEYACAAVVLQTILIIFLVLGVGMFDVSNLGRFIIALIEAAAAILVLACAFAAGRDE